MATVQLFDNGSGAIEGLPPVCIDCGRPATGYLSETYRRDRWRWVKRLWRSGSLGDASLRSARAARLRIETPYCTRHWYIRRLVPLAWYTVTFLLVAYLTFFLVRTSSRPKGVFIFDPLHEVVRGSLCGIWFMLLFLLRSRVRAKKIDDHSITLPEVSPSFVKALAVQDRRGSRLINRLQEALAEEARSETRPAADGVTPAKDPSLRARPEADATPEG